MLKWIQNLLTLYQCLFDWFYNWLTFGKKNGLNCSCSCCAHIATCAVNNCSTSGKSQGPRATVFTAHWVGQAICMAQWEVTVCHSPLWNPRFTPKHYYKFKHRFADSSTLTFTQRYSLRECWIRRIYSVVHHENTT